MTSSSLGAATLVTLLAGSSPAVAQATQAAAVEPTEEIVVTGTHIVRDGFEAPTPVSVISVEQIQNSATANVADYLNTLPALGNSMTPTSNTTDLKNAMVGVNALNLRALGAPRTLVLMDGQRVGPSTNTGVVDINTIPQQLISRVDVVTGGASSTYGSDALSGVVNFIMDNKFTGIKGEVSGGVTTYGDNRNWKVALTGGTGFANGRGHFIVSGEVTDEDAIPSWGREWQFEGYQFMVNPAYGTTAGRSTSVPQNILMRNVGLSNAALGGMITCTTTSACAGLRGITFGPGGTPYNVVYGSVVSDPFMSGGTWNGAAYPRAYAGSDITPSQSRQNLFTRVSYQVADNWEVYAQASWNHSYSSNVVTKLRYQGNLTIRADNAFIPASVAAQAVALGITQFAFGTLNGDIPSSGANSDRRYLRFITGVNGSFGAFGTTWNTSAYFQASLSKLKSEGFNINDSQLYNQAIDAVRGPNGAIVCRSTLTNPGNGCIPFNLFGIGVNSQNAINYVTGSPYQDMKNVENAGALTFAGEPFSIWAGPVSFAFGIESRKESGVGTYGPIADVSRWFFGAGIPANGSFTVTEGFVETVVPLATDAAWAKSLNLNGAVRVTDYSSGTVATWKIGAEYSPIDDIRFRATRSHDVREPNINDLYAGGTISQNLVNNPFDGGRQNTYTQQATGNSNLVPEKANTLGAGVVVQPSFFPGFTASFDYYDIKIKAGIGALTAQQTADLCFQGNQAICSLVTQGTLNGAPIITRIMVGPVNLASERSRGFDIEAAYQFALDTINEDWTGRLGLRALATHAITDEIKSGIPGSIPVELAGQVATNTNSGPPRWRYETSITYDANAFTLVATIRGVSSGVYNNNYIECTSGCPVSTAQRPTYDTNFVAGASYLDLGATYRLSFDSIEPQLFFNVRNIMNKDPFPFAGTIYIPQASSSYHDVLGRVFRAGVRFTM